MKNTLLFILLVLGPAIAAQTILPALLPQVGDSAEGDNTLVTFVQVVDGQQHPLFCIDRQ